MIGNSTTMARYTYDSIDGLTHLTCSNILRTKPTYIHVVKAVFFKSDMAPFWLSKFCLLLLCSFICLLEQTNAITPFLAILLGPFRKLTILCHISLTRIFPS